MSTPPGWCLAASGMATGIGLSAPATCAAIRCGLNRFIETRFSDGAGGWVVGSPIPWAEDWRNRTWWVETAACVIDECLQQVDLPASSLVLVLGVPPAEVCGREDLTSLLRPEIEARLGATFHPASTTVPGRSAGISALAALIAAAPDDCAGIILCGIDQLVSTDRLDHLQERGLLRTSERSDGVIPGDAAAAALFVRSTPDGGPRLHLLGIGTATEPAPRGSGRPAKAAGLTAAGRAAMNAAGVGKAEIDFWLVDVDGTHAGFREIALAKPRLLNTPRSRFDVWHTADCTGDIGAATVPLMLGHCATAMGKGYAPGTTALIHGAGDSDERVGLVVRWTGGA